MYREALRSLENEEAMYFVDDYLSAIESVHRNPTRCGSNIVYFSRRGLDHSRSITYLLNTKAVTSPIGSSGQKKGETEDKVHLSLVAQKLVSAALAIRRISRNSDKQPPIDVSFILLGSQEKELTYQYLNAQLLKEAIMVNDNATWPRTHLVIVESTGLRACNVHKGCLVFKVKVKGRLRNPAFTWLGENPWEALIRLEKSVEEFMKPRHDLYPVELGKANPMTLQSFLVGYPTIATTQIRFDHSALTRENRSIESEHYVSLPPEFSHEEFKTRLLTVAKDVARISGCELSINQEFIEEPFQESPHSLIIRATSAAFVKSTGFEPIFEWLPFPVSAKNLESSGFAKDVVAIGPGDWTSSDTPNERSVINEILLASGILAQIPYEVAALDEGE